MVIIKVLRLISYLMNMDIKKNKAHKFVFLIAITLLCYGCPSPCPMTANYNFHASMSVFPGRDSLEQGDTIFFKSLVSAKMHNLLNDSLIRFDGALNFGATLRIGRLKYTSDTIIDAVNSFLYQPIVGRIYTVSKLAPNRVKQLLYEEQNNYYVLRFGLITKDTGTYVVSISDAINVTRNKKNNCERANIKITIQNEDKHLNYLRDLYYKGQPIAEVDKTHSYCFVVK